MSPTSSNISYYLQPSKTCDGMSTMPPYMTHDYFQPPQQSSVVFAADMPPATLVYLPPVPQTSFYTCPSPTTYANPLSDTSTTSPSFQPQARKIVITQLSHRTTHSELEKLLYRYIERAMSCLSTTGPQDELCELNIVTNADRRPRGHAFAVLSFESLARYIVQNLDGYHFQGRELKVRFAKEGVDSSIQYLTSSKPQMVLPFSNNQTSTFESSTASTSMGRDRTSQSTPSYSKVRTSARGDGKAKRDSKEKSRHLDGKDSHKKKKISSPLVVNGSSEAAESRGKMRRSW